MDRSKPKIAKIREDLFVPNVDFRWPLAVLVTQYLSACVDRGLAERSVKSYRSDLTQFMISSVTKGIPNKEDLAAYKALISPLSAASRKRKLMSLSGFCTWLEEEDLVTSRIFKKSAFRLRLPQRLPRNLTRDEIESLLLKLRGNSEELLITRLLLFTGVRVAEFCDIRRGDFDPATGTFRINGKGKKQRVVPLCDELTLAQLRDHLEKKGGDRNDPLFLNRYGNPLNPEGVRALLRRRAPGVTPHMLRHTCATLFCEAGMNVRHVQRMLGHSSLAITEQYIHVSEEALAAAAKSHPIMLPESQPPSDAPIRIKDETDAVRELYRNKRYRNYLVKRGVADPEDVLQEAAVRLVKSPPPPGVEVEAACIVEIRRAASEIRRREKTSKRGKGKVVSFEDLSPAAQRRHL